MGGSHPAANGGAWMTAVLGFGGVQADEKRVAINPRLCRKWKRLNFHLAYKGDNFRVNITKTSVTVASLSTNARTHSIIVAGRPSKCSPGSLVTVKYRQAR
jgi:kojibiose phosphorylase